MSAFPRAPLSPQEREAVSNQLYDHGNSLLKVGIHIELTWDFNTLKAANRIAVQNGGIPLMPLFDPERTELGARNAFALIGRVDGAPVCTMAGVLRHVDVGLQDALEDLTLLYDRAALDLGPDAWCEVDADGLNDIRGRVLMLGALWRDPALRTAANASAVGAHLFAMAVLNGYRIHKPNYFAGMMAAKDVEWLGYDKERFRQFHHGVRYVDADWPHTDAATRSALVTMSRARMKAMFLGLPAV
jgi:hypothetical protein